MVPMTTLGEYGLKLAVKGLEEPETVSTPLGPELAEEPEPPLPQAAAAARTGARTRVDTARHLDLIVEPHFATPGFRCGFTTQAGTAATGSQHCRVFTDAGTEPVKRQECGGPELEPGRWVRRGSAQVRSAEGNIRRSCAGNRT